jgi:protein-S-isoprenylcysteine O-methyltransferase Ste14
VNTPPASSESKQLSYLNLAISEKGLSEFSGGRRIIFVPKDEVQIIEIKFGSSAERPLIQTIVGLMLVALGCVGLSMILSSGMRGLRWGLGFLLFGGFGIWFLHETFKKNHYLWVICRNDRRKLVFRGAFQEADFSKFINDATKLGYSFKDCVKNN